METRHSAPLPPKRSGQRLPCGLRPRQYPAQPIAGPQLPPGVAPRVGWGRRAQGHSRQLLQLLTVKGVFDELADAPVRDVVISQAKKDIKKKKNTFENGADEREKNEQNPERGPRSSPKSHHLCF